MADTQIKFGRLVKNVSDCLLPLHLSADQRNVDITKVTEVTRRKGHQRALNTNFAGEVTMVRRWVDYDGEECYIVIGPAGVYRET